MYVRLGIIIGLITIDVGKPIVINKKIKNHTFVYIVSQCVLLGRVERLFVWCYYRISPTLFLCFDRENIIYIYFVLLIGTLRSNYIQLNGGEVGGRGGDEDNTYNGYQTRIQDR